MGAQSTLTCIHECVHYPRRLCYGKLHVRLLATRICLVTVIPLIGGQWVSYGKSKYKTICPCPHFPDEYLEC